LPPSRGRQNRSRTPSTPIGSIPPRFEGDIELPQKAWLSCTYEHTTTCEHTAHKQLPTIVSGGAGGNSPQPQPHKNTSVSLGSKPLSMPDSVLTTATTDFGVTRGYLPPPAWCRTLLQQRKGRQPPHCLGCSLQRNRERKVRAQHPSFFWFGDGALGRELNQGCLPVRHPPCTHIDRVYRAVNPTVYSWHLPDFETPTPWSWTMSTRDSYALARVSWSRNGAEKGQGYSYPRA